MAKSLERFAAMGVLIVDDNAANVALLEALLVEHGLHRVYVQTDSREVSRDLAQCRPDLVLLDLHMPHLDGHQVLTQIQRFAAGQYLPVLVLTADTTTAARDRALRQGAQDYLTKPLDTVEAVLRIANLLQTRQLYSVLRSAAVAEPDVAADSTELDGTRARIEQALRGDVITAFYQPVVDVQREVTVGYEGLSRFADTSYGGPDRWFDDAFRVGLGVELEWFAARNFLPALQTAPAGTFLALNMSPATILHMDEEEFCAPQMCPRIVIELTEHVPVQDYDAVRRAFAGMRAAGSRLAADDLGAGYAGFRHLLRLEPDIIKLDISLVAGIDVSRSQRALAAALVAFAADVGVEVIAEGVETAGELAAVRDLGVRWAQGYYLHKPVVAAAAGLA